MIVNVQNADVGPVSSYYTNITYNGVMGFNCTVDNMRAFPGLLDQNGNQIASQYLAGGNDITWYQLSMSQGQTLVVGLVITNLNVPQPYTIILYSAQDLRAVPRAIGPVIWVVLFVFVCVFEYMLWREEKKYGAGSDNAKKETRRKTRFFSRH